MDLLCFCSVLCLLCFVRVCLYVLCGHLLGKGWPLGSSLWCLLWVCHFPIGILGQVWYLIVSFPDLCTITYFCSRTPLSDAGEAQTRGPSVSSQALYHWATALPFSRDIINLNKTVFKPDGSQFAKSQSKMPVSFSIKPSNGTNINEPIASQTIMLWFVWLRHMISLSLAYFNQSSKVGFLQFRVLAKTWNKLIG